jgi:hypothetical protein
LSVWQTRYICFTKTSHSVEKPHLGWFYFCGFNFAIIAGLFVLAFGRLLGRWRSLPAAWLGIGAYAVLARDGFGPLNPPEWIERWQPQVILLSVAAGDEQGRPDPQVLQALQGCTLLRADQNGWIELSMDGEKLWVEVEGT